MAHLATDSRPDNQLCIEPLPLGVLGRYIRTYIRARYPRTNAFPNRVIYKLLVDREDLIKKRERGEEIRGKIFERNFITILLLLDS